MVKVSPTSIRIDATGMVSLVGAPPHRAVKWAVAAGSQAAGAFVVLTDTTDAQGRAFAQLLPASQGTLSIEVSYGA